MHVRPFLTADIPRCGAIAAAAFAEDPLLTHIHPYLKEYPEDWFAYMTRRVWYHLLTPDTIGIVAVADDRDTAPTGTDSTASTLEPEKILGYAFHTRHPPATSTNSSPCQLAWQQSPFAAPFSYPLKLYHRNRALRSRSLSQRHSTSCFPQRELVFECS